MNKRDLVLPLEGGDHKRAYYALLHTLPFLDDLLNGMTKLPRPGHMRQLTYMKAWLSPTASKVLLQSKKVTGASTEQITSLFTILAYVGATDPLEYLTVDTRIIPSTLENCFIEACKAGALDVARIILDSNRFSVVSKRIVSLFLYLCKEEELDLIWFFLRDERLSAHIYTDSIFACLCEMGLVEAVTLFLADERIDPGMLTTASIGRIRKRERFEVIDLLQKDGRALIQGAEVPLPNICEAAITIHLSNPNLDPKRRYDRIFIDACYLGDWDLLECLLAGHEISDHLIRRGMIATCERGQQDRFIELVSRLLK